jgi:hypothetical protein
VGNLPMHNTFSLDTFRPARALAMEIDRNKPMQVVKGGKTGLGNLRRLGARLAICSLLGMPAIMRGQSNTDVLIRVCLLGRSVGITAISAANMAAEMLAEAGIRMAWQTDRLEVCQAGNGIVVELIAPTPARLHPHALACAQAFEGTHIQVFYDRVQSAAPPRVTGRLLAHVLVHEIIHVLTKSDYHAESGVMKAHWTEKEIEQMAWTRLSLDRNTVKWIRRELATRRGAAQKVLASTQ